MVVFHQLVVAMSDQLFESPPEIQWIVTPPSAFRIYDMVSLKFFHQSEDVRHRGASMSIPKASIRKITPKRDPRPSLTRICWGDLRQRCLAALSLVRIGIYEPEPYMDMFKTRTKIQIIFFRYRLYVGSKVRSLYRSLSIYIQFGILT